MSRKIIANRKFLEEQVRNFNTLKEKSPEPYTTRLPGGLGDTNSSEFADPYDAGEPSPERIADPEGGAEVKSAGPAEPGGLSSFLEEVGKEIIDVPVLLHKKLERHAEFAGSFIRQALKRAAIESSPVKEFFSIFKPIESTTTSITKFRYDFEQIFDTDLYEIHPELIRRINLYKKTDNKGNRRNLYLSLISFFKATNTDNLIITDEKVENLIKEPDFDKFVISLFKRDDANDFMSIDYSDVFDFLSQVKEELLNEIKSTRFSAAEALTFLVVSEVDPQGSSNFGDYKRQVFKKLEEDPDMHPWNIVRGLGQMGLAVAIEKRISKRPLTFWRSLFIGVAVSLALDWGDENLRGNYMSTTYGEIEDINNLLKEAENIIVISGEKGGASMRVEEQIRKLILEAVDIVKTQFRENMESEGLMMSMPDRVGSFEKLSQQLEYANSYFDASNFSVTSDNYKTLQRNIQYFRNALIMVYKEYKVSLAEFSPLEEIAIKDIKNIINRSYNFHKLDNIIEGPAAKDTVRTIGGVLFKIAEVKASGLSDADIEALIETYGITESGLFSKVEKILGGTEFKAPFETGFGKFALEALSSGAQNIGQFRADFIRETKVLKSPYIHSAKPKEGQQYLLKNYGRSSGGMYFRTPGTGGLISSTAGLCAIFAPELYKSKDGTNTINWMTGYNMRGRKWVGDALFKISHGPQSQQYQNWYESNASSIRKKGVLFFPFLDVMGKQQSVWPGRYQSGPLKKGMGSFNDNAIALSNAITNINNSGFGSKLLMILAIHDAYWGVVNKFYDYAVQSEIRAVKALGRGNLPEIKGSIGTLFKFLYAWAEIDYYTSQNNISFFRNKHRYAT